MNSPSSSDTTVHPWRMWRLSESDLYCVAMKMWRSPELMQLLRTKSMMRYGPPKYTAGFARSRVSGASRSPAPPASTITSTSSPSIGVLVWISLRLLRPWEFGAVPWPNISPDVTVFRAKPLL